MIPKELTILLAVIIGILLISAFWLAVIAGKVEKLIGIMRDKK